MMIGISDIARKRAFLEGLLAREGNWDMIDEIKWGSDGRKLFQTSSNSVAEQKVLETRESLPTSSGVVLESMAAIHPSGNSPNSVILLLSADEQFCNAPYINIICMNT
jgi:hypothetical protein